MASWPCFICGEETREAEYVEVDGFRRGSNPWTCAKHVAELIQTWRRFFPGSGSAWTEGGGMEITWDELKRIEEKFERDVALRKWVYEVTDKEIWAAAGDDKRGLAKAQNGG